MPQHKIHAALHAMEDRCWKIYCTCDACGERVILTVDDAALTHGGPESVPTERNLHALLDRHCGLNSLPLPIRGVPPIAEAIEALADFHALHRAVMEGFVRNLGIPAHLFQEELRGIAPS